MTLPLLETRDLHVAYDGHAVLQGVTVRLAQGELVGLVGPNGAGKSTLLRALLDLAPRTRGEVLLGGTPLRRLRRGEIAKRLALLPQDAPLGFAFSVQEVVAMGRFPHLGRFQPEGSRDRELVRWALEVTDTAALAARPMTELSGGERQRVMIARALAQETECLLLDEPTANLDLAHQLETLGLASRLVRQGRCVVAAIHDLSIALRFCTRLLLLSAGQLVADGPPQEVLTEENLARYFRVLARVITGPDPSAFQVVPLESLSQRAQREPGPP